MHIKFSVVPDCGQWTTTRGRKQEGRWSDENGLTVFKSGGHYDTSFASENAVQLYTHIKFPEVPDCGHWSTTRGRQQGDRRSRRMVLLPLGRETLGTWVPLAKTLLHCLCASSSLWFQIVDTGQPRGVDNRDVGGRMRMDLQPIGRDTTGTWVSLAKTLLHCICASSSQWFQIVANGHPHGFR